MAAGLGNIFAISIEQFSPHPSLTPGKRYSSPALTVSHSVHLWASVWNMNEFELESRGLQYACWKDPHGALQREHGSGRYLLTGPPRPGPPEPLLSGDPSPSFLRPSLSVFWGFCVCSAWESQLRLVESADRKWLLSTAPPASWALLSNVWPTFSNLT